MTAADRSIELASGVAIFSEGDAADCAFLVEEGWVEIFSMQGARRQTLSLVGPGEIFGEMAVIDGSPRSASASVAEDCRLLRIDQEQFNALLGRVEPFHAELMHKLVARFRHATRVFLQGGDPGSFTAPVGPGYAMLAEHRDIAEAIGRGEIEPYLQPIVDLATNRWRGFEALARWRCPRRGLRQPADFLPLAERTGLIRQIDWAIARQAMLVVKDLDGHPPPYLNINFSAWHFRDGQLAPTLAALLAETGMPASRVRVELTESLMLDEPEIAMREMRDIAALGAQVALDDFGTGYSSLSVLHRMPIHVLKIDRVLMDGVTRPGRPRSVMRNLVALAADLAMEIVCEGIEDAETVAALRDLGCGLGQGYLFARPMAGEQLAAVWQTSHMNG
ncbi:MAG TPA: EAL domain-containing protein [Rhodospirillaceae bacterium]|nr:EAL domain-containing protein [Rhodospirillaceae bacterium]